MTKIPLTTLKGQLERITYSNAENGYTIARLKVYGRPDLVTIVGNLLDPAPGEVLEMTGEWQHHPKYGEQFKVVRYQTTVPATVYGIRKYLGSGLIKGIGPVMAKRIVQRFGKDTLTVIEESCERLAEIQGIGQKRIRMIQTAWEEQKEIREVMMFLQSHGVSSGYATKIFKHYGSGSITVVTENPYRLAMEIFGIGFKTADQIAMKLGFTERSPQRVCAGIIYVLHQLSDEGHVYYPYESLIAAGREILSVEDDDVVQGIAAVAADNQIVIEDLNHSIQDFQENNKAVFLQKYHFCETSVTRRLQKMSSSPKSMPPVQVDKALAWIQERLDIRLAGRQIMAVQAALESKVLVITGGPGTGKTTIINAVLQIFQKKQIRTLLAAPTGRAAKRMSETTGMEARTIHRLLEFSMAKGGFQKDEEHPLDCEVLVVDEASMIDTVLMHHLLKAVPSEATLILVGDVNQLPSVGAGNVLRDIIASERFPVVILNEIFRQAQKSRIIVNAHKINQGIIPYDDSPADDEKDFYFIQQEDPQKVLEMILKLVKTRIPGRFGFHPVDDIQVLSPMHRGVAGAGNLNQELQQTLNPEQRSLVRGMRRFLIHDKVMQIRNNYDKDVYNGDIGRIEQLSLEQQEVVIRFDGRDVVYDFTEMDEVVLAYAVSVHKSQGSEYPVVVMPVLTQHYMLLQRNLIYTAITRGRRLVVLVGSPKALAIGVKNDKTQRRYTRLRERLIQW